MLHRMCCVSYMLRSTYHLGTHVLLRAMVGYETHSLVNRLQCSYTAIAFVTPDEQGDVMNNDASIGQVLLSIQ